MRSLFASVFVCLLVLVVLGSASAQGPFVLTDGNSSLAIDLLSPAGAWSWQVDGVNHLYQQWWWYRIGDQSPEMSVDTIGSGFYTVSGNTLNVTYTAPEFDATFTWQLLGGAPGSLTADVAEQARINNKTGRALPFHLFEYSNFNLSGTPYDDTAVLVNQNAIMQYDSQMVLDESTIAFDRWQIAISPGILAALNDGVPTNLPNTGSGLTGDVEYALQWDGVIQAGGTMSPIISKDKGLRAIPEWNSLLLAAMGLVGTVGAARRRRS